MALRLVDKLFTQDVLMRSTVYGTKDFASLDVNVITAIKAEVLRSFGYQCRNSKDFNRMWESCKISIGKHCQNLRTKGKDGARVD